MILWSGGNACLLAGGVLGFWGGVWLLGACFMVVLMAKNYCCNTDNMAKEDI